MIGDLVVAASLLLTLAFVAIWAASPALRARIERPKYRFLDAAADYDRADPSRKESA